MHAAFQRPAGAHPCGTLIRWFSLAALAPPPANLTSSISASLRFRDASGVQKRTARPGTLRVLLRVERAEHLGDGNG